MLYHRILEKEPQEMWTLRPRHSLWTMYLSTIQVRLCVLLVIVALFACGFEVYLHLRSFILNIRSTRDTLCDIFTVHAMSSKIPVRCILGLVMQDARSYWGNSTSLRSCQVHSTFCWIDYLHKIEFLSIMNSSRQRWEIVYQLFTHLDICNKELGEVIVEKMKIIYVNCGVKKNYTKEDHRSYICNFCSCGKIAWKKNQACTGFELLTCAIPIQRSTNDTL